MTNSKSTKWALITSALAILLCVVMLIGTTFAWFTDTASTGVNTIQAGNLKMAVTYKNATTSAFTALDENTNVFKVDTLWEPGHVEYAVLNVKNTGTLALKYQLGINIANETGSTNVLGNDFNLSDYIRFAVLDGDKSGSDRATLVETAENAVNQLISAGSYSQESHLDTKDASETVTLVVWMPTDVGNEANYKVGEDVPVINLGINVVATQYTKESDSFNDQYDAQASYPVVANTQTELNDAIAAAQSGSDLPTKVVLPEGEFKLENATAQNKNITISGTEDTVVTVVGDTGNQLNYQNGATLAFEGVTIQGQTGGVYGGIAHVKETTFVNCTLNGKLTLYGDATFINCTFNNDSDYAIWTWGAKNAEFIGCTFNSGGKAILLYGGSGRTDVPTTNLTVTNCTFNDNDTLNTNKAAIEIGNDYNATYTLTVNNATVNGFAENSEGIPTGSKIWANKDSMDPGHLNVVIDGVDVY